MMAFDYTQTPLLAGLRNVVPEPDAALRDALCTTLIAALDRYYVHLPQKRAAFAIDPVRQLQLLRSSDGVDYVRSLLRIVGNLRDRHTRLTLGEPWTNLVAFVPFVLERFFENGKAKYVVTKRLFGFRDLPIGAEVTYWNGVPIDRYVRGLSLETQGANPGARMQLAISNLTIRPLGYMLMPQEDWVTLNHCDEAGTVHAITTPWRFVSTATFSTPAGGIARGGVISGVDEVTEVTRNFATASTTESNLTKSSLTMSGPVRYGTIKTPSGDVGYLRITSFEVADVDAFIFGMQTILSGLPQDRLVIDVRNNPGGVIPAGQRLIGLLTGKPVTHSPIAFRNTAETLDLVRIRRNWFEPWLASMEIQLQTGEQFSQAIPLVPSGSSATYHYPGRIVLIIDALCYSTTDFFAADFRDNGLGRIIGVDPTTGGGGANVVSWNFLVQNVGGTGVPALPYGYDFSVSLRRSLRTGGAHGIPVEDLGVPADIRYWMTRADVLENNRDLLNFAAAHV